jgi:hypothetical protein
MVKAHFCFHEKAVVVAKARKHTVLVCATAHSRFRYNTMTYQDLAVSSGGSFRRADGCRAKPPSRARMALLLAAQVRLSVGF